MEKHQRNNSANGKIMTYMEQEFFYPTDLATTVYASWASIDYYGRWKALHYYARRFFAPVLLSCEEESMMTKDRNINAENTSFPKSVRFNVSNETGEEKKALIRWQVRKNDGSVIREEEEELSVPALTASFLPKYELEELDPFTEYVSYELFLSSGLVSSASTLFIMPKYFRFKDLGLSYTLSGDEITVHAGAFAKSEQISNEEDNLILSDNFFDMNEK